MPVPSLALGEPCGLAYLVSGEHRVIRRCSVLLGAYISLYLTLLWKVLREADVVIYCGFACARMGSIQPRARWPAVRNNKFPFAGSTCRAHPNGILDLWEMAKFCCSELDEIADSEKAISRNARKAVPGFLGKGLVSVPQSVAKWLKVSNPALQSTCF